MKLKYKDFVGEHIVAAINRITAIRPAPLVDVSHSLVINIRRINAKIADFVETNKVISKSHEKEVLQFKSVLFLVPETADIDTMMKVAKDRSRIRKAITNQEERKDGVEVFPLDFMPAEILKDFITADVFDLIDFESTNTPTEPVLVDGTWNFIVLQESVKQGWIFRKDSEQFQLDMDELWDTEVEIDIRVITNEAIKKSQEKRPGFVIPTDDMLTAWFMFEAD